MEDKVFTLIEKMYAEMNDKFDKIHEKFDKMNFDMNYRFDILDKRLTKVEVILQDEVKPQVAILTEGQQAMTDKLDGIAGRVDRQDLKIQNMENTK